MRNKQLQFIALLIASVILIFSLTKCNTREKAPMVAGLRAPEIEVLDAANGKKINTAELNGKVIFINFWASWCEPCREEIPSIEGLFNRLLTDQNFVMLTILFRDDPQYATSFLKQNRFNLPVMVDRDGRAARAFGLTGVPETFIVDKKGVLRKKIIGPYQWDSPEVIAFVSELLRE